VGISLYERGVNMTYVPPLYPTTIPTVGDLPDRVDDVDWLYAARYNELKKELRAALTELGTTPKGASADVAARLATLAPKASPVFTGQATIPTINLTGGQIVFPTSEVTSADPNTITDYQVGTWTIGITFGGAAVNMVIGTRGGAYTKIGNRVFFTGHIALTNKGTSTGAMLITGLPFVTSGTVYTDFGAVAMSSHQMLNTLNGALQANVYHNSTVIYPSALIAGLLVSLTDAHALNATALQIVGHYRV